jgi:hypothetical protein
VWFGAGVPERVDAHPVAVNEFRCDGRRQRLSSGLPREDEAEADVVPHDVVAG